MGSNNVSEIDLDLQSFVSIEENSLTRVVMPALAPGCGDFMQSEAAFRERSAVGAIVGKERVRDNQQPG